MKAKEKRERKQGWERGEVREKGEERREQAERRGGQDLIEPTDQAFEPAWASSSLGYSGRPRIFRSSWGPQSLSFQRGHLKPPQAR